MDDFSGDLELFSIFHKCKEVCIWEYNRGAEDGVGDVITVHAITEFSPWTLGLEFLDCWMAYD